MNSPDFHSKDELDGLVRDALRARVGSQEPPERVWTRIREDLAPGQVPPRRLRARWLSLAAQSVLTLLLAMLGVAGLQTAQLSPTVVPVTDLPQYVTDNLAADGQDSAISRAIVVVPVEPDVDALKTFGRPVRQANAKLPNRLSETALLERRLLRGEPAAPFPRPVQERFTVFSLPPEE